MSEVRNRLDRAAEDTLRTLGQLAEVERIMNLSTPDLKAQHYDGEGGGTVLWCEDHERVLSVCRKAELDCDGIPLPKKVDPTGDDAVSTRIWEDVREANRRARRMEGDAAWFVGMCNRWRDADPTPAVVKDLEDKNLPRCERHLRYGFERDARSVKGTRVRRKDGTFVFAEPHKLCEFCEDFARDFGRLATEHEIHANADGKRLRRPA